jgi:hypothetical protein
MFAPPMKPVKIVLRSRGKGWPQMTQVERACESPPSNCEALSSNLSAKKKKKKKSRERGDEEE